MLVTVGLWLRVIAQPHTNVKVRESSKTHSQKVDYLFSVNARPFPKQSSIATCRVGTQRGKGLVQGYLLIQDMLALEDWMCSATGDRRGSSKVSARQRLGPIWSGLPHRCLQTKGTFTTSHPSYNHVSLIPSLSLSFAFPMVPWTAFTPSVDLFCILCAAFPFLLFLSIVHVWNSAIKKNNASLSPAQHHQDDKFLKKFWALSPSSILDNWRKRKNSRLETFLSIPKSIALVLQEVIALFVMYSKTGRRRTRCRRTSSLKWQERPSLI